MEFNTTFMSDFTIAEQFGPAAVQDTYERVFVFHKHKVS